MADAVTNFSAISTDAPNVWVARETYRLAERRLQLGQFAKKHQLVQRMGKTLRVVRYKRLALPSATLTEGTPPDAVALSVENVDVTVEQWGIVVLLTDVAQITTEHPALQIAVSRTAMAMAEVLEREMAQTLLTGTQVRYATGVANRAALTGAIIAGSADILAVTTLLRSNGAEDFEGGLFGGVMPPQIESDVIASDATFKDASNFANVRRLDFGEIGVWMGVRWVRGNFLPYFHAVAAPTTAAATAEKAQVSAVASTGKVTVVARDINSRYQRKVSIESAVVAATATLTTPTSTNYVYDVYADNLTGVYHRVATDLAANFTTAALNTLYAAGPIENPPAAVGNTDGDEVFIAWVFGKDAFGRVELDGMSLQSYITPAGASYSNPLAQGRKVGSKIMWKSFVIDNAFFGRIEANSAYSANLPA